MNFCRNRSCENQVWLKGSYCPDCQPEPSDLAHEQAQMDALERRPHPLPIRNPVALMSPFLEAMGEQEDLRDVEARLLRNIKSKLRLRDDAERSRAR